MREYSTKEMKLLRANPYTLRVTKHKLYLTVRFKEAFQTSYEAGNSPRKVLEDLGYDPKMFGQKQMLWSSVFVTRVSNQLMSNILLRMVYDIRYKNAVVHGCRWYKQNVPQRGRETPHLDTREDKFLRSSAY